MKTLTILCLVALLVFMATPVFACGDGGGCDKDKDQQVGTIDAQTLCGGDKPAPNPEPQCGGGDKKDKDETKA